MSTTDTGQQPIRQPRLVRVMPQRKIDHTLAITDNVKKSVIDIMYP